MKKVTNVDLSPEYQTRQLIYAQKRQAGGDPSLLLDLIGDLILSDPPRWPKPEHGDEARAFCEFAETSFNDGGLEWSVDEIKTIMRFRHRHEGIDPEVAARMKRLRQEVTRLTEPAAAEHGSNQYGDCGLDIVNSTQDGNAASYALRRLKRDRPDLAEQVVTGELSANAAAIKAGFRKKTVTVRPTVEGLARAAGKHLDSDQIVELIERLIQVRNQ